MKEQEQETILTNEGYKKLTEELEHLKNNKRNEVAERIKIAISFGDLSENSEYEDAKREQAHLEGRISDLEKNLSRVKIIKEESDSQRVKLGSKIKVKNINTNDELVVKIVGSMEFDPENLKISNESPIGKALLGKKVGNTAKITLPSGTVSYKILEII